MFNITFYEIFFNILLLTFLTPPKANKSSICQSEMSVQISRCKDVRSDILFYYLIVQKLYVLENQVNVMLLLMLCIFKKNAEKAIKCQANKSVINIKFITDLLVSQGC